MINKAGTFIHTGTGPLTLLTILFITFKLLGHITWSWWWVFAPIWIPWSIIGGILILALPFVFIKFFK